MKLTPYIHFSGNAEESLRFYAEAIGEIKRYGESPMPVDDNYKEKVLHARLTFGADVIMISDSMKGQNVSTSANIQLAVEIAEGGRITMPLEDIFWGARFGMLEDKFGVKWMFNYELKK